MSNIFIQRRQFLKYLTISTILSILANRPALASGEKQVLIEWQVPAEQLILIRDSLDFKGKSIPVRQQKGGSRSPVLLYILVGTVGTAHLAETLLRMYKDWKYGGILITKGKNGSLQIESRPELDRGTIMINQGHELKIIQGSRDNPTLNDFIGLLAPLIKK
jgi:hypothetical protein